MKANKKLATLTAFAVLATPFLTSFASAQSFTDVSTGAWYTSYVTELTNANIAFGTDSTHYAPNAAITRGEVAQMLYNALSKPAVSGDSGFSDVAGSPYATAIAYAKQQGIINGYPDGTFKPTATITRQEAAKMIWNVVGDVDGSNGKATPLPKRFATQIKADQWGNKEPFPDNSWGEFYVNELALNGVISGYPDGTFKPNGQITRAEFAKILDGVLKKVGYTFGKVTPVQGLKDNGDGTSSFVNVPNINTYSTNNIPSDEENTAIALVEKVAIKFDGDKVTVTLPDTGTKAISWVVQGSAPYDADGDKSYDSINGATLTYDFSNANKKWISISTYQTSSGLGEAGMLVQYTNGQWVASK